MTHGSGYQSTTQSTARQAICLNRVVKSEASITGRCLASVKPFVNRWGAVDTGTPEGIRRRQA